MAKRPTMMLDTASRTARPGNGTATRAWPP
jgi:hypothetical protein